MPLADKTVYNLDWLVVSGDSNVNIATSRDWHWQRIHSNQTIRMKNGAETITLSNVLHVPEAPANFACLWLLKEDFDVEGYRPPYSGGWMEQQEGSGDKWKGGWIRKKQTAEGRKLALVEARWRPKLRLKGQQLGYISLKGTSKVFKGLRWPSAQIEQWEKDSGMSAGVIKTIRNSNETPTNPSSSMTPSNQSSSEGQTGYTLMLELSSKERRWLDGAYGGEAAFLRMRSDVKSHDEATRLLRRTIQLHDDDEGVTE